MTRLQHGERQTQRTKEALTQAFVQLMREKKYQTITIQEITNQANTGRSTFYRHFQSKADVLLSLHEDIFARLSEGLSSTADWLADEPPAEFVMLLTRYQQAGSASISFTYELGNDHDYVVQGLETLLSRQFEQNLYRAFSEDDSTIPFFVLARSIAGTYSWLIQAWFAERRDLTPDQIARYIHWLTRAAIQEAFSLQP